jgi:hypothetical protein
MVEGTRTSRTSVASIRTDAARPLVEPYGLTLQERYPFDLPLLGLDVLGSETGA